MVKRLMNKTHDQWFSFCSLCCSICIAATVVCFYTKMVILLVGDAFNGWLQAESPVSAMAVVIMTIDDAIKTHHGQFSIINHSNIIVLSFNLIINHGKSWQSWKQFIQKFLIKQQMMMMSVWMLLQQQRRTAARQTAESVDHSLLQWRNWWYARHTSRPLKIPFMEASRRLHFLKHSFSWLTAESRRTRRKMMHAMQWSHHIWNQVDAVCLLQLWYTQNT